MKRLLSLATLYPNAHAPRFGTFVARSLEALAARGDWQVTVINPIGVPPVAFGRYKALAAAATSWVEHCVSVNNTDAYRAACVAGLGLMQAPYLGARSLVLEGKLVEILADYTAPPIPVSLLYPHKRNLSKRVRIFMDWLSEILKPHLS